jgi:predicted nuclease with TOPRIM domain
VEPQTTETTNGNGRAKSGYARLKGRHRAVIAELSALKDDYEQQQIEVAALQKDIERLLAEHRRLMANVKAPADWFSGAKVALSQLAQSRDEAAISTMTSALGTLLQRLAQIRLRASQ